MRALEKSHSSRGRGACGAIAPGVLVAGAALVLLSLPRPSSAAAGTSQRITVGVSLTSFYDSNILEYSSDLLAQFEGGTRPERFSLETTDDLVWNPAATLGWEWSNGRGRRHALRLRGEGDFHQKNSTADMRSASVGWRESWSRDRRLSVAYYTLPHFYLRQLVDEDAVLPYPDLSRYRRAEFGLTIASLDWSQRIGKGNSMGVAVQHERRRYNDDFRERDSGTHQAELAWGWTRLPHRGTLELRGLYRVSQAKAEDGDEVAGTTPDDVDVSYHGIGVGAHGEGEMRRQRDWRVLGDADIQFTNRVYDSDRTADKYHFGRKDGLVSFELGLSARWGRAWRARAYWHRDANTAKLGAAAPSSTDTGDYRRSQVGLRLDWSGTLHRSKTSTSEEGE